MRNFLLLFSLLLSGLSCAPEEKTNINCRIEGLKGDSALIAFIPQSNTDKEIVDTVKFIDGKLSYDFPVTELHEAFIIPYDLIHKFENGKRYPLPASRINFFINSEEDIDISGIIKDKCVEYEVVGNSLSEQLTTARKMKMVLFKERVSLEFAYNSNGKDKIDEGKYWELLKDNSIKYQKQSVAYIKEHPDSEYAASLLLDIREKETVTQLYDDLTSKVKKSHFGTMISDIINGWMITTPGLTFPNMIDQTIHGKTFELARLKGKYVLIDFWGSWCKPCLEEVPQLKKIKKLYNKRLEIVGIACNDNKERLLKTIESYEIDWKQIAEAQTKETNYSVRFGVRSFPTKILLDPEGRIINIYTGLDEALYEDISELLGN